MTTTSMKALGKYKYFIEEVINQIRPVVTNLISINVNFSVIRNLDKATVYGG